MAYQALESHFRRLGRLQHAAAILQWDEAVMMPPGGGEARGEAMATLDVVMHELLTDPRVPEWIAGARKQAEVRELDAWQAANVREIARVVARAKAVPTSLVEASRRATARCEQAWRTQRQANDFAGFAPLLREVVALRRETAQALGAALGLSPYDALLDEYEPGCRSARIDELFAQLKAFLPDFIDRAIEAQRRASHHGHPVVAPHGPFPIASQEQLGRRLMTALGFDFRRGRQDVSRHPFCGGVPSDVRITTRYDESDFSGAMMAILHETGHAKYEQGLPSAWTDLPVGVARSMSIHEGQSLLHEMQIARGLEFLTFAGPIIAEAFPEAVFAQPSAFEPANLHRLYTRVAKTKIRVGSDEVTYPCHILLRYDIERALIDGRMQVEDLPEAWDAGMRDLLGISTGEDHRDGCMQDVHWSGGAFGYFPTYTLGAMTAAQVFAAARRFDPLIGDELRVGSFERLDTFLRDRLWSQASRFETEELLRQATGETLQPRYFIEHLKHRYLPKE